MRIGIIIGRIGGVDGVALETEKWIDVFERMGHEIFIITGEVEKEVHPNIHVVEELSFFHPLCMREQADAFFKQKVKEETLQARIEHNSEKIEKEILRWMVKNKIECILSENSSALPYHLSLGVAIERIVRETKIATITHDHDFAWERGSRYKSKYKCVKKIIKECFPLKQKEVVHGVISSFAKGQLKKKFNLESICVPNVMDFEEKFAKKDSFNSTLRKTLGLNEDDILIFQITRIVRRKGIEVAIQMIHDLEDPRMKLIITGSPADDPNGEYFGELVDLVTDLHLEEQVIFAHTHFDNERRVGRHLAEDLSKEKLKKASTRRKVYSLSDAYAHADACTYFSTYEGFGNAYVEAVLGKVPIFVNNYEPVYWPDIGSLGFKTVQLEKNKLTKKKLEEMREILVNKKKAKEIAEYNFKLGQKHFSYNVLEKKLEELLKKLDK